MRTDSIFRPPIFWNPRSEGAVEADAIVCAESGRILRRNGEKPAAPARGVLEVLFIVGASDVAVCGGRLSTSSPAGSPLDAPVFRLLLRHKKNRTKKIRPKPATPPTTPPATFPARCGSVESLVGATAGADVAALGVVALGVAAPDVVAAGCPPATPAIAVLLLLADEEVGVVDDSDENVAVEDGTVEVVVMKDEDEVEVVGAAIVFDWEVGTEVATPTLKLAGA